MNEYRYITIKGLHFIVIGGIITGIISILLSLNTIYAPRFFYPIIMIIGMIGGLIFGLILLTGIIFMFKGKKEFTQSHEESVTLAGRFLIYGVIIYMIGGFYIGPWILNSLQNSIYTFIVGFIQLILSIPLYLVPVFLIKELVDDNKRKLLWIGFFLLIIFGFFASYLGSIGEISSNLAMYGVGRLLSIIPLIIFLYCYYKTYISLKEQYPVTSKI
jgi:hypothetical protein